MLLTGSTFLAVLLREHDIDLAAPATKLDPGRPLPMTFSPYRLRFRISPTSAR